MLTQSRRFRFSYLRRALIIPVALLIFGSLAFVTDEKIDRLSENLTIPVPQPEPGIADGTTRVPANQESPAGNPVQQAAALPAAVPALADTVPPPPREEIFTFVEQPPTFPGGDQELNKFLSGNIRYPKEALENKIGGTVFVSFIVTNKGEVTDVKTVGAKKGGGLEEEAARVVKAMPNWKPGKQNNREVSVQFNLPIRFTLAPPPPPQEAKGKKGPDANGVYTFVDRPPTFPGGDEGLNKYLSSTIRYPKDAIRNGKQGTIFVSFIVNENGELNDIQTVGEKKGGGLEEEAMRVVKGMPKWTPGEHEGKDVPVRFNLPIRFVMQH